MTSSEWSQFFSWHVLINSGKDFAIGTKLSLSNLWPFSPLSSSRDLGSGSSLSFSRLFYDEHWSKHRVITCLDWSPQVRPETFPNSKWFAKNEPCLCWYFIFSYPSLDVSRLVSLSFLSQYPELLVASYNNNEDAPHEPDGVALVWNIKFKKATPEYIFHCQVCQTYTCQASHLFPELLDASPDVRRLQVKFCHFCLKCLDGYFQVF